MKGKYLIGLGVSLLAIGAAAGFVGTKRAVEARAMVADGMYLLGDPNGWQPSADYGPLSNEPRTVTFEADDEFKFIPVESGTPKWDEGLIWGNSHVMLVQSTDFEEGTENNNIKVKTAGDYKVGKYAYGNDDYYVAKDVEPTYENGLYLVGGNADGSSTFDTEWGPNAGMLVSSTPISVTFNQQDKFKITDVFYDAARWKTIHGYTGASISALAGSFTNDAQDNIVVNTAGTYNISVVDGVLHVVDPTYAEYKVTKYAVEDGVKINEPLGVDDANSKQEFAIPAAINSIGYEFGGWFTDVACTVPYVARTLEGNIDLYAKLTCTQDKYIYYVSQSAEATPNYIYTYGGSKEFGEFPGTRITDIPNVEEVQGVLHFQDVLQRIYKIPYSSTAADTHVVLNVGSDSDKTGNMTLTHQTAYWYVKDATTGGPNDVAAQAIEFLHDAEAIRNAATYKEHSHSVCGVSAANAGLLVARYEAFEPTDRVTYIDSTKTYTYSDGTFAEESLWSYYDVMQELARIAESGSPLHSVQNIKGEQTTSTIVIASLAAAVGIGFVTFFVIRRRKINL